MNKEIKLINRQIPKKMRALFKLKFLMKLKQMKIHKSLLEYLIYFLVCLRKTLKIKNLLILPLKMSKLQIRKMSQISILM